ncbi:MAG: hypothetical protein A2X35_06480 [Elusimicrobia bacterium GWA2_61_42]|nr:MAG: hypothetical protein A2X35_06480 [Elusimicrobia bacterium GWA2_61_42]OGR78795.1 MAG: hypothetical protein A2X38_04425 [Elusimicrobia bacterium GWC2_61_25]
MNPAFLNFPAKTLAALKRLDSPRKVQDFLDYEISYNDSRISTCLSPLEVLKQGRAHCIEGAMLAAAAFLFHGRRSMLLDLRANPRDDDHVIAPFLDKGRWGAVAQSHFCGLRYREPVYRSFGELARSYFEFYYNRRGEKTLREFSAPLETSALKPEWLCSGKNVFFVGRRLDDARHFRVLGGGQESGLRRADSLLLEAEVLGGVKTPLNLRGARPYRALKLPRSPR